MGGRPAAGEHLFRWFVADGSQGPRVTAAGTVVRRQPGAVGGCDRRVLLHFPRSRDRVVGMLHRIHDRAPRGDMGGEETRRQAEPRRTVDHRSFTWSVMSRLLPFRGSVAVRMWVPGVRWMTGSGVAGSMREGGGGPAGGAGEVGDGPELVGAGRDLRI